MFNKYLKIVLGENNQISMMIDAWHQVERLRRSMQESEVTEANKQAAKQRRAPKQPVQPPKRQEAEPRAQHDKSVTAGPETTAHSAPEVTLAPAPIHDPNPIKTSTPRRENPKRSQRQASASIRADKERAQGERGARPRPSGAMRVHHPSRRHAARNR